MKRPDTPSRAWARRAVVAWCHLADSDSPSRSDSPTRRFGAWRRGLEYGFAIYAAGFALGIVRSWLVAPRIGERRAQLLEVPLMLLIGFVLSGRVRDRLRGCTGGELLRAGALAIVVLLVLEAATGMLLRGGSVRDALINPDPVAGAAYYAALLFLLVLPALRARSATGRANRK
ncbi:MAG: hypothetical protein JSR73_06645 [Proteobacteria bacterium]|nr:hypothetical protein [Pseudomonadota bacterium]